MSRRNGRRTFYATLAVLAVVVALTGWWFGFGRYTTTPKLVGQTQAQAVAAAKKAGFEIRYGSPLFEEKIPKDTVVEPAAGGHRADPPRRRHHADALARPGALHRARATSASPSTPCKAT